jgi:hypothetical protein
VKVIDDILDNQELDYAREEFRRNLSEGWIVNKFVWQNLLHEGHRGYVLMRDVSSELHSIVSNKIKEHVQYTDKPGMMFYMWNEGSAINWHHDDHVDKACTIYLNDWPIDLGGQFVYKDGDNQHLIPIKANRMVVNDNHTEHKVTPVRRSEGIRFTIQVFGK